MKFTPAERQTLTNCLRVAAERFADDAKVCRAEAALAQGLGRQGGLSIAEQFDTQQALALALAARIEDDDDDDDNEVSKCGKCGEWWPCTVVNHPKAYTPAIVAEHFRATK